jgi:acetyl esterase
MRMTSKTLLVSFTFISILVLTSCTQQKITPLRVKERYTYYKTANQVKLMMHIFEPQVRPDNKPAPAILFFFGGGWVDGDIRQFYPQCEYFASRGMVAIAVEYRIRRKHKATPFECVADGKSAIRWVRANAGELGIDPDKVVAAGGSAGGHVAACIALIDCCEEKGEDLSISSMPDALVLFNPVIDTSPEVFENEVLKERWKELSPVHNVKEGMPPTIILHGTEDTIVPLEHVVRFCELMKAAHNLCELAAFEGEKHGFFNHYLYRKFSDNQGFRDTLRAADQFLSKHGFLIGEPTI